MKLIGKQTINGKTVLATSRCYMFRNIITAYEAQREFVEGHWDWLKLPDREIVPDYISFQLDAWNRLDSN